MIENIDGRDEQDIQRGFRRDVIKLLGLIFMSLIAIFVVVVMVSINQSRLEALEKEILSKLWMEIRNDMYLRWLKEMFYWTSLLFNLH